MSESPPLKNLVDALETIGLLIAQVSPEQWSNPTPCEEWDVRGLVDHLVRGNLTFGSALAGHPPVQPEHPGQALGAAYQTSVAVLLDAFRVPGVMEKVVTVPFGSVPGIVALHLRIVEALVHGWDLAQATGQPLRVSGEVAEQELAFTNGKLGDVREGSRPFGPPQPAPEDAPAIDRLAACLGRRVTARHS